MNEPEYTLVPGFILVIGVFGVILFAMLWALFKPWQDWLDEMKKRNDEREKWIKENRY